MSGQAGSGKRSNPPSGADGGGKKRKVRGDADGSKQATPRKETLGTYRLKKGPKDSHAAKDAYYECLRLLWGLESSTQVPTLPPADVLTEYNKRFADGFNPLTTTDPTSLSLTQQRFLDSIANATINPQSASRTQARLAAWEEQALKYAMAECKRHQLMAWRPDFRSSPNTPYNTVHRMIAENIFVTLASSHAFAHKRINLRYVQDEEFLRQTFNHFVFYLQRRNWKKELVTPGSVSQTAQDAVMFNRRGRLKDARVDEVGDMAPRRHLRAVEDPAQHSCDERKTVKVDYTVPGTGAVEQRDTEAFVPYGMPMRSAKFTRYYAHLDKSTEVTKARTKRRPGGAVSAKPKIPRIRVPDVGEGKVRKLPDKTPIDWFNPDEFNALPPAVRRRYAHHPRVAFPLDEELMYQTPPHESMTMKEADFMKNYGEQVLALYHIPGFNVTEVDSDDPDAYTTDEEATPPAPGRAGGSGAAGGSSAAGGSGAAASGT